MPWRDGRAAEGACLENMFGVTPNVGSNPTPSASELQVNKWKVSRVAKPATCQLGTFNKSLGRCQSGRMGPPAKRLPGRNPRSQVRILSSPPLRERVPKGTRFSFRRTPPLRGWYSDPVLPATTRTRSVRSAFLFPQRRRDKREENGGKKKEENSLFQT